MKMLSFIVIIALIIGFIPVCASANDDALQKLLRYGILGAGTGAISAAGSGGKAGKGALIGLGTGLAGSMIMDALTQTSSSEQAGDPSYRHGFENGYRQGYEAGYNSGFTKGFEAGNR